MLGRLIAPLRRGRAWVYTTPKRTFNVCATTAGAAMVLVVALQPIRDHWAAALATAILSPIPIVVGLLMLTDWRGMTAAWTDAFYPSLGFDLPAGRSRRPLQMFWHAGTRFWGLLFCGLGVTFAVYGVVYLVRDIT
jgi:hypothetical protein